jgi:hypothetical protein
LRNTDRSNKNSAQDNLSIVETFLLFKWEIKMRGFLILLVAVLMAFNIAGGAAALTVKKVDGTTYNTTALTGFSTSGDMMVGMTVIATFSGGAEDNHSWASTGSGSGGVSSASGNWSLDATGNTFDVNAWSLTVDAFSTLTNLFIDAGDGDTVFDIVPVEFLSPGSAQGRLFDTAYGGFLTATYSGLVGVAGTVYDDLYRTLNLDFGSGGFSDGTILFSADTDNLEIKGDLHPADQTNPVPEPTTMLLLGTGLMGLAGFGRKKFNKKR